MAGTVLIVRDLIQPHAMAEEISEKYTRWQSMRSTWEGEKKELRNYLFATDTRTTSNSTLPWKNTTTLPKLTQIRDNLHANYMEAMFPNDNWFIWEGHDQSSVIKEKREIIEAYMRNKVRISGFGKTMGRLLYDYIDYGNAICDVEYVHEKFEDPETGLMVDGYIGPRLVRISPLDIVFNPLAPTFEESPKITRHIKNMGELENDLITRPDLGYSAEVIAHAKEVRRRLATTSSGDVIKADGFAMDGFENLADYYESGYVEILEFEGTISDENGKLRKNRLITVIDRSLVVRDEPNPSWTGSDGKSHVGWRQRPDNLYGMGPLDNLVGMQYRIDHLENIKADLYDFIAHPPLLIKGNVEAFDWEPFVQIQLGDDGDVSVLKVDATALTAANEIANLIQLMEEMAGAPREAMGIRSPGEKTAFEVQKLDDAASRIFQEKIRQFEIYIVEPALNNMLEVSRRNMPGNVKDVIRTIDDDIGVIQFMDITKDDLSASGKLRPKGASHFAARNMLVQNLNTIYQSPLAQVIAPHVSPFKLAQLVEEAFGWEKHQLVGQNIAVEEQQETANQVNAGQEDADIQQLTAAEEPIDEDQIPAEE